MRHSSPATASSSPLRPATRLSLFALLVALLSSACAGGSDDELTTELEIVRTEAAADVESAEAALAEARADFADAETTLREEIAELEERNAEQTAELEAKTTELEESAAAFRSADEEIARERERVAELEDEIAETIERAEAAEATAEELLNRYDPEIRAAAQVAWDAAVAQACEEAGSGTGPISVYVDHTDELEPIGNEDALVDAVTVCAEPLRSRSIEERLNADCVPGSVDTVTKDPDGLRGNCYSMYVVPWQWDSRTGECNFLGSWDGANLGLRSFVYDGDGLFRAPASVCANDLGTADQDDLLQIWATLDGAYRYDTAAGGTNEIPEFTIERAVLVTKG